ncbi:hypothetical protein RHECNPAF_850047 [Rhizobium etli CNPAF512]|nr:hypothetical protein RHECNPAF_850047 [Rhizobium etli CNPAF512]
MERRPKGRFFAFLGQNLSLYGRYKDIFMSFCACHRRMN